MAFAKERISLVSLAAGVAGVILVGTLLAGWWLVGSSAKPANASANDGVMQAHPAVRLALVPERNIIAQRERYLALAAYLGEQMGRSVELVTLSSYPAVLDYLKDQRVDGAFLGSFITVLAHDRLDAKVLVKPIDRNGVDVYRGQLLVREDSDIVTVSDLRDRSIAMVRATMAGHLFPMGILMHENLLGKDSLLEVVWAGTHDEAIELLLSGKVEVAAVKDLRFQAYEEAHGPSGLRILIQSKTVPNNALVVGPSVDEALASVLKEVLLDMDQSASGREALEAFGAQRFVPCDIAEYQTVYELIGQHSPAWAHMGFDGPPPTKAED